RTGTVFYFMLVYLGVLLFSMLFAREPGIAVGRVATYVIEGLLLFWLVVNVVRTERVLRRAIWTVVLAGALLAGLSLYQAAAGAHRNQFAGLAQHETRMAYVVTDVPGEKPRLQLEVSERAGGPLGEPNRYAQILLVLVPIAAALMRRARSITARVAAAATLGLLLAGIVLTYSRGGLLTLALLVLAGIYLRWVRPRQAVLGAVLMLVLVLAVAPGLGARLASITGALDLVRDRPSAQADAAIRGRVTEMLASLNVFLEHPLVGVGPGQYLPVYSVDYQQSLTTKFRDLHKPRRAHNLYLEIAAETGILGIIAFLAIMATLALQLRHARACWAERDPEYSDLATAFLLALGVYLTSGLLLHLAFERYLWLMLALAAAMLHTRQPELAYYAPAVRRVPTLAEVHRGLV
ncbi:MAG TPA: O-antigen ligase family protein, partial [Longimicrobiales bacterium]|nr:O-antigen ligase family protein [Longimicrobiales bacterium]